MQEDPREAAVQQRRDRVDAWRAARNAALPELHAARAAHKEAMKVCDRYAPGKEKDAAGVAVNAAANRLAVVEKAFKKVNTFQAWEKSN